MIIGVDLIRIKVLKKALNFLTVLFNADLGLSHFPTQWKHAKIIVVNNPHKPEHCTESYRPISLLPAISKLFSKLFQK